MLQLQNITKDYITTDLTVHALRGITLDFRKCEFVSILGASGCGKTTLMNIIGGLDKYTAGNLIINGKSTNDFKDKDWDNYRNKKIGFIFQSYNLISHISVLGNVELALTLSGVTPAERKHKATEALARVGLEEQINKFPNQLSGGQMQRVAIARALVNSPDILLADEPTGALDSETSEQILQLISEIAAEKLVIMVTHNPELANKYSNRLVKMKDGIVISDSNPYDSMQDLRYINEVEQEAEREFIAATVKKTKGRRASKKAENKTAMSYLTALSLSFRNLLSKKGRTVLTAIAGSIGIIGIAVILAFSNGMNLYIDKTTAATLASSPITISTKSVDMTQSMSAMTGGNATKWEKYPDIDKIFVDQVNSMADMFRTNKITPEYISYLDNSIDKSLYNDILYKTGLGVDFYGVKKGDSDYSKLQAQSLGLDGLPDIIEDMFMQSSAFSVMLNNDFVGSQYDLLRGNLPQNKNEVVVVVDQYNRLTSTILETLGILGENDDTSEYGFDDIMFKEFKVLTNAEKYMLNGSKYEERDLSGNKLKGSLTVEVVGIIRVNESTDFGSLPYGIAYSRDLEQWLIEQNKDSDIAIYAATNDPFTGKPYTTESIFESKADKKEKTQRTLGGISVPNEISIYPKDFDSKASIREVLDGYNNGKPKADKVAYVDMSDTVSAMMGGLVDVISYVLIGFTSISLLVSSVMIGIITYVSVLERTKEIGILRSIGARKKDITRVFNAETIIIGVFAGVLGVIVAALLTIPINLIINAATGVAGIATLSWWHAIILVVISVTLTLVSGLIPSKKAARKDPVSALRSE